MNLLTLLDQQKVVEILCQYYKKPALCPLVGFSLAKDFNETVTMDLKPFRRVHFSHITDHTTRHSQAAVIPGKRKDVIINKLFQYLDCSFWL